MATTVGVVIFPGTNCEMDAMSSVERLGGHWPPVVARR